MPATVPLCTHTKTNGVTCGSPAVSGTELCCHHSRVKMALGKVTPLEQVPYGAFTAIPFLFPEDRASLQINYFLLLQALVEQRVERRAADLMFRMLRAMGANLGKTGSLVEGSDQGSEHRAQEGSDHRSAIGDQEDRVQGPKAGDQETSDQETGDQRAAISVQADADAEAVPEAYRGRVLNDLEREYFGLSAPSRRSRRDALSMGALQPAGQRVLNKYYSRPLDD